MFVSNLRSFDVEIKRRATEYRVFHSFVVGYAVDDRERHTLVGYCTPERFSLQGVSWPQLGSHDLRVDCAALPPEVDYVLLGGYSPARMSAGVLQPGFRVQVKAEDGSSLPPVEHPRGFPRNQRNRALLSAAVRRERQGVREGGWTLGNLKPRTCAFDTLLDSSTLHTAIMSPWEVYFGWVPDDTQVWRPPAGVGGR